MRLREGIVLGCAALGVGLFQSVFLSLVPFPWSGFQPAVLAIVYLTLRGGVQKALLFSLICGFIMDAFTPGGSSFFTLRFVLIAVPLSGLATSLLTNRSLYASVALDGIARLVDWTIHVVLLFVASVLSSRVVFILPSFLVMLTSIGWDTACIVIVYLLRALLAQRFVFFGNTKRHRYG